MAFDTLNPNLRPVADAGMRFLIGRYGRNGLKTDSEIDAAISWKPSILVKPSRVMIVAAEVEEELYPTILKIAGHDIKHFEHPVSVYVICPLDIFLADKKQTTTRQLKRHGFGIITVDDDGVATMQHSAVPLAQHISEEDLDSEIRALSPNLKVRFKAAHTTYQVREGQGLQEAGQIVEAIVNAMADEAVRKGVVSRGQLGNSAANTIDALYALNAFRDYRATLGGARQFMREYRNIASHAPRSAAQAMEKIRKCRVGFLDAVRSARDLHAAMKRLGYRLTIHVP
jgi:hypothetical protein